MDLGGVGLDGLMVGSETGFVPPSSDPETRQKFCGSGFFKQGRSTTVDDDDLIRGSKVAKINAEDASGAMLLQEQRSNTPLLLLRSNNNNNNNNGNNNGATTLFSTIDDCGQQQQMLSFSTPKSETLSSSSSSSSNAATLSYSNYHQHPLSSYSRNNAGYSSWGNMHGGRGAASIFTASQWVELEQQALIYKYITANVPVPSHLLNPIRKALDSAAFCNFSNALLRPPNALGWGGFHLGFSGSTDPEPGRCRRTDGKKWRCSRDAVVDQKYCERHMNRGRHRSRKPVEGLNSGHHHHSLTTTTATTTTTPNANTANSSSKLLLLPNSNSSSIGGNNNINGSIVVQGNSASNNNTISFGHSQGHTFASDASAANSINRMFMNNNNKENNNNNASERIMQNGPALPMLPPKENPFMIHHHHHNKLQFPFEESSSSSRNNNNEFGLVTSDSLLNPSNNRDDAAAAAATEPSQQHSLWNFIDDCPKTATHNSDNRTQHSIDFISFNSSSQNNTNEKLTLSPLRLSRELELDPIQMGLGVGSYLNDEVVPSNVNNTRQAPQASWIPIAWERSSNHHMGGPLGEVLNLSSNNNNNSSGDHRCGKESNLNLTSDGWDNNSPSIGSSPTGVLQKTAFGSLSNSSAGSSPRGAAENNKGHQEGASLCNDLLGSANA